jgi:hypothetical protein
MSAFSSLVMVAVVLCSSSCEAEVSRSSLTDDVGGETTACVEDADGASNYEQSRASFAIDQAVLLVASLLAGMVGDASKT